jgi:hypothetical protein
VSLDEQLTVNGRFLIFAFLDVLFVVRSCTVNFLTLSFAIIAIISEEIITSAQVRLID